MTEKASKGVGLSSKAENSMDPRRCKRRGSSLATLQTGHPIEAASNLP